tara:strand:- start:293 stop:1534 length:1242 start_codon:yes stop_codon:yes gene_type:complete
MSRSNALSWEELTNLVPNEEDLINGPNNPYSTLRLFGQAKDSVRVILYRDNHAWCPYCQKVWLWLEFKKIPYKVEKVTMRCYGEKESWYKKKVPSGMLPALSIDGFLITESDQILLLLEKEFGPHGNYLSDINSLKLRNLERRLFRVWCSWLCTPSLTGGQELNKKNNFQTIAFEMEKEIGRNEDPWMDKTISVEGDSFPGSSDIIFIPYLERMNASLAYYKGFNLRKEHKQINKWLEALEQLEVYRGTQGDMHTHSHDLPPQMGGCWKSKGSNQSKFESLIDRGIGLGESEQSNLQRSTEDISNELIALRRVIKHRTKIVKTNQLNSDEFDQPLRAALTRMVKGIKCQPNKGSAVGLRYLRDRISVPRDMPLLAARKLRIALEETAEMDGVQTGIPIPKRNRLDQNPANFRN